MKKITLTQGYCTLVDDEDYKELSRHRWCVVMPHKERPYAGRQKPGHNGTIIFMHRQIMGTPPGYVTNHIDGDGLNNQRRNLRICTRSQNAAHQHKVLGNVPYRGVIQVGDYYNASFKRGDKFYYLGSWLTAKDAARAFDLGLRDHSPDYGVPNFEDTDTFDYKAWQKNALDRLEAYKHQKRQVSRPGKKTTTKVPYRGVFRQYTTKGGHRFIARLQYKGKRYYLGFFTDPEEAARCYDAKARALGRSEESLNFPKLLNAVQKPLETIS